MNSWSAQCHAPPLCWHVYVVGVVLFRVFLAAPVYPAVLSGPFLFHLLGHITTSHVARAGTLFALTARTPLALCQTDGNEARSVSSWRASVRFRSVRQERSVSASKFALPSVPWATAPVRAGEGPSRRPRNRWVEADVATGLFAASASRALLQKNESGTITLPEGEPHIRGPRHQKLYALFLWSDWGVTTP